MAAVPGSSPLARGLRLHIRALDAENRIIPARAGFTHDRSELRSNYTDHPRSRGVYDWGASELTARVGSSPLARGLLALRRRIMTGFWIIPARAGFTPRCPGDAANP